MVKIKKKKKKRLEDIEIVNKYKPDFIGFVFANSKRKVSYNLALNLRKNLSEDISVVGVFVDADKKEILKLYDDGIIDIAQLHGNEDENYEISQNTDLSKYDDYNSDYLLLDSGKGSGKTFDWNLIKKDLKKDFFLAGGLNSSNISQAICEFNPYAVDLSSALEVDGFKDENKIKEIMEIIK